MGVARCLYHMTPLHEDKLPFVALPVCTSTNSLLNNPLPETTWEIRQKYIQSKPELQ